MHSSTSSFERVIPALPWRGITVTVVVAVLIVVAAWEVYCRSLGYEPTLNETDDLWAETRRRVQPESVVIIGDSRAWFDSDLDALEQGLGKRPVQLAMPGGGPYPVLEDLANDESFHGTVLCSVVPALFFAPAGPPVERPRGAVKRFHGQTWAQRISHQISVPIELSFAFLKQEDLTMAALLPTFVRSIANAAPACSNKQPGPVRFRTKSKAAGFVFSLRPASEFRPAGHFRRQDKGSYRGALSRHENRGGQTSRPRRQDRFRAVSGCRAVEGA